MCFKIVYSTVWIKILSNKLFFIYTKTEVAVPAMLGGMSLTEEIQAFKGLYPWVTTETGDPMNNAMQKLATLDRIYFAHPIKINQMIGTPKAIELCASIIQVNSSNLVVV